MQNSIENEENQNEAAMSHFLLEEDFRGWEPPQKVNIILMIGDGMGPASMTMARLAMLGKGESLNLDPYICGTIRTFSSSSWVTDSAAAATAYASGIRTYNEAIGVDPQIKPIGTIMEAAKQQKEMKLGLVVTTRISDATPAAFFAHSANRNDEAFIISQILQKDVDVILGGGKKFFTVPTMLNGQNTTVLKSAIDNFNYTFVSNRDEMLKVNKGKILGLFDEGNIPYEIDRIKRNMTQYPTLQEMTTKALHLLNQNNPNGFFLMVEGSKIDVAGHENDAATQVYETKAFDETFKIIKEFAEKDKNTIILVTADHETGGLTLGMQKDILKYPDYEWDPTFLLKVNASALSMAQTIMSSGDINIQGIVFNYTGVVLTDDEVQVIKSSKDLNKANPIGKFVSKRANIGFTTFGHTGVDVNLYSFGTTDTEVKGSIDNIALSHYISSKLKLDLDSITKSNFNPKPT
eukprot:gene3131-3913_t